MYKFRKEIILLIKIFLTVLIFIVTGFEIKFSIYVFLFLITLILLPSCFVNENIGIFAKIAISLSIGIMSILTIIYLGEIGRMLTTYISIFFLAHIYFIVVKFLNKSN